VGLSEDYTKATAYTSILVGENQIFQPERNKFDEMLNDKILSTYKPKYWKYASLPAKLVADEERINGIKVLDSLGAMTANDARDIGNELFSLKLPRFKEKWAELPFRLATLFANRGKLKGMDEYAYDDGGAVPGSTQDKNKKK
jgi:capsid portal protein